MNKVYLFQLGGFFISSLAQIILLYLSTSFSQKNWVCFYCVLILVPSSLLCLKGLWIIPYLEHCILLLFFSAVLFFLFKKRKVGIFSLIKFSQLKGPIFYLLFGGIFLEQLYAALPVYRPDLWDYHLTISKIISLHGKLSSPIFNDHIYFSGIYEYFFVLFRVFIVDDVLMQSVVCLFSLQSMLILFAGVSYKWMQKTENPFLYSFFALAFVHFALPSHNMVSNAKIEPLLVGFACLILTIIYRLNKEKSNFLNFMLGFLLIAPIAGKVVWIHFMICVGMILLVPPQDLKARLSLPFLIIGGVSGALLVMPFCLKNYHFFGNPFHPIQAAIFSSDRFSSYMSWYWQRISAKAQSLEEFSHILISLPWGIFPAVKYLSLGFAFVFSIRPLKGFLRKEQWFLRIIICKLAIAWLIWPFFYNASIFPRFYFPLLSLLMVPFFLFLARSQKKGFPLLLLLIPLLLNSSVEVKLSKIFKTSYLNLDDFFGKSPSPMPERNYIDALNKHRRKHFPEANLHDAVTLADTPRAYFYDGLFMYWAGMDYDLLLNDFKKVQGLDKCIWAFLQEYRIHYLYSVTGMRPDWGHEYQEVWNKSTAIGPFTNIVYLSEELVSNEAARCR